MSQQKYIRLGTLTVFISADLLTEVSGIVKATEMGCKSKLNITKAYDIFV